MSCSLMFSGISARVGTLRNLPLRVLVSKSSQAYFVTEATLFWMTSRLLERSRTATVSPAFTWVEGMLHTLPLRVMWWWDTS